MSPRAIRPTKASTPKPPHTKKYGETNAPVAGQSAAFTGRPPCKRVIPWNATIIGRAEGSIIATIIVTINTKNSARSTARAGSTGTAIKTITMSEVAHVTYHATATTSATKSPRGTVSRLSRSTPPRETSPAIASSSESGISRFRAFHKHYPGSSVSGLGNPLATKWDFEAEYIQSCNCDYGCPCNFNGHPTHGNCEALVAYHIRKGNFGATRLDGVTFAEGMSWPKAIHEGNGVGALYIDPSATVDQRKAIEEIWSGKHGGGVFEVFAKSWTRVHMPKTAAIDFHYGGYDSSFSVEGVGEVRSGHIRNPVTGVSFSGELVLPGGINFKRALVTSIQRWSLHDGDLQMDHENCAGFATITRYNEKGPIASNPISRRAASARRGRRRQSRSR